MTAIALTNGLKGRINNNISNFERQCSRRQTRDTTIKVIGCALDRNGVLYRLFDVKQHILPVQNPEGTYQ